MKNKVTLLIGFLFFSGTVAFSQETIKEGPKTSPTIALHGRIQYDLEFMDMKADVGDEKDFKFKGEEFRRVYLSGSGKINKNLKYKVQFEFAGAKIGYRDVYLKYMGLPGIGGNMTVGSFAEATGLDMATSSKYIPFLERAMLTNTQNFRWNSGFMYDNFGILNGKLGLQLSYGFNGKQNEGFKDEHLEEDNHIVARLTSPVYINKEKNQLVHLGINYEHRKRTEDPTEYTLSFRPENHIGDKVKVLFPDLKTQADAGFELAAILGPLSFQGEYETASYETTKKTYNVNGYYAAISYFLTGDHRSFKNGAFSRTKPLKDVGINNGGYGAFELVARYSVLDYSDIVTENYNDKVSNITMGLNWYLNSRTRLMYNMVISDFNKTGDNNKLYANLIRLQADF